MPIIRKTADADHSVYQRSWWLATRAANWTLCTRRIPAIASATSWPPNDTRHSIRQTDRHTHTYTATDRHRDTYMQTDGAGNWTLCTRQKLAAASVTSWPPNDTRHSIRQTDRHAQRDTATDRHTDRQTCTQTEQWIELCVLHKY